MVVGGGVGCGGGGGRAAHLTEPESDLLCFVSHILKGISHILLVFLPFSRGSESEMLDSKVNKELRRLSHSWL